MKPLIISTTILAALIAPAASFYALGGVIAVNTVTTVAALIMLSIGVTASILVGRVGKFWGVLTALLYFPLAWITLVAAFVLSGGY